MLLLHCIDNTDEFILENSGGVKDGSKRGREARVCLNILVRALSKRTCDYPPLVSDACKLNI